MYESGKRLRPRFERGKNRDDCPDFAALCLIRFANFRAIRRELGRDGASLLTERVLDMLARHPATVELELLAPDLIECRLDLVSPKHLHSDLIKLSSLLDGPIQPGPRLMRIECLIGATLIEEDIDDIALIERAEHALSMASAADPIIISSDINDEIAAQRESELIADLPYAALRDQLVLAYQPKLDLRKREIRSCEALIRWNHPDRGVVMPDGFIYLADRTGEIAAITLWTIDRVIADQRIMSEHGHDVRVFVNISGRLLTDDQFVRRATAMVTKAGADIGFEITETSVIQDPDIAIANLTHCAESGISLAIDDYGSGLSSLAYLKRLPASELKIDKMFVTGLSNSHRDPLIVRSTIDLAHALEMKVTAEGVETPAALALLSVMGCDFAQGYLISAARNIDEFIHYLDDFKYPLSAEDEAPSLIRPASFWGQK